MKVVNTLASYSDENGNKIFFSGSVDKLIKIVFKGKNNVLHVHDDAIPSYLYIGFYCDNGLCEIGKTRGGFNINMGQDCTVKIADDVTTTDKCSINVAEGATVSIGRDCMFAIGAAIRADDAHAIFDVESGLRVNPTRDVTIGEHVWFGEGVTILGGTVIHNGCVIGLRSVVKGVINNNCVAAGIPAKVIKKNIAWERPHLNLNEPYYKPDASSVKKSQYWNLTDESDNADNKKTT